MLVRAKESKAERQRRLKRERNRRWLEREEGGTVVIQDLVLGRPFIEEMIAMGYLGEDESASKAEIEKALRAEHADLVALHRQKGRV